MGLSPQNEHNSMEKREMGINPLSSARFTGGGSTLEARRSQRGKILEYPIFFPNFSPFLPAEDPRGKSGREKLNPQSPGKFGFNSRSGFGGEIVFFFLEFLKKPNPSKNWKNKRGRGVEFPSREQIAIGGAPKPRF